VAFIEVTPNGKSDEKMLIQVSYIMSIVPMTNSFQGKDSCKILVPGMMFEVKESYAQVKTAMLLS